MNIYKNKYSFKSLYSFNLIKKLKRTLNFGITKIGSNELHFHRFKSHNARLIVL
jgi:hypothetical protein